MQPPPIPESSTITYQVPRDVLIRIWWRRMFLRPRLIVLLCLEVLVALVCFFLGNGAELAAYILLALAIVAPISIYRAVVKAVQNDPQLTDRKSIEFSPSRLVVTGSDWKTEVPWTRFRGFSEDETYFYLHLADNGLASIVPKSAFKPEQQQRFREYAKTRNT
jgi:hypothetical protein